MANDGQVARRDSGGALVTQPQRLGFLPTMWFWRAPENWRVVRLPLVAILIGSTVALAAIEAPVYVALGVPALAFLVALGAFERFIRARAKASVDPELGSDHAGADRPSE